MSRSILKTVDLNLSINGQEILKGINIDFYWKNLTTILGPSGCGKTTLIRCFNRLCDLVPGLKLDGKIMLFNKDLLELNPIFVRRKIGMVFQRPNPFPSMSIYENVLSGYSLNGIKLSRAEKNDIAENALSQAALWDEVKDYLHKRGSHLSGGQQQRLCIARSLAMNPRVLLLDEPTSALDPNATANIEELLLELKKSVTIIMVTHNISQAARISDQTAFLYLGELIEYGPTKQVFTVPKSKKTEEYLSGKFG